MSKKIYLSLDDLHKLYGLSPAVITAIKKKRKKRRNKKNKIQNGTMGNKPSDSSHMEGYSSALAVAAKQLQQTNINKHIQDINDKNEKIRIEHEPDNLHPNDPDVEFFHQVKQGVKSGTLKATKTATGFSLVNKALGKKPGPKKKSDRVEELPPEPEAAATFTSSSEFNSSGLSNNYSRNMNRDFYSVLGNFVGDSIVGSTNRGTGDEKFVSEATPIIDVPEQVGPTAEEIAAKKVADEQELSDELNRQIEEKNAIAEENRLIEEQDALDAELEQQRQEHDAKVQAQYKSLTKANLDAIAKANGKKFPRGTKTNDDRYNFLKDLGLIPEV